MRGRESPAGRLKPRFRGFGAEGALQSTLCGSQLLYDGKPVELTPEQEEVATMFAAMRETDYAKNPIFQAAPRHDSSTG